MKKLIAILILSGVVFGASAQHGRTGHGSGHSRISTGHSRVGIGVGIGTGFGYGRGFSNSYPFYNSPYNNYYNRRPSNLDLQIQDVESEFRYKKREIRQDRSLSSSQKRQMIRDLRREKEKAIIDTKRNYYYNRSR
jgi:hypothetical protein